MRQLSVLPTTVFFFQTNLPLRDLVQYISTRKTSCHPEILVEIAGPHLAVAGAAFGGTLTTQIPRPSSSPRGETRTGKRNVATFSVLRRSLPGHSMTIVWVQSSFTASRWY